MRRNWKGLPGPCSGPSNDDHIRSLHLMPSINQIDRVRFKLMHPDVLLNTGLLHYVKCPLIHIVNWYYGFFMHHYFQKKYLLKKIAQHKMYVFNKLCQIRQKYPLKFNIMSLWCQIIKTMWSFTFFKKNSRSLGLTQDTSIVIYFSINCIIRFQTTRENTLIQAAYQPGVFCMANNVMSKVDISTK